MEITERSNTRRAQLPSALTSERMHEKLLVAARCMRATLLEKFDDLQFPPLRVHIDPENQPRHMLGLQHGSGGAFGGDGS
jgi:hypothetical protein